MNLDSASCSVQLPKKTHLVAAAASAEHTVAEIAPVLHELTPRAALHMPSVLSTDAYSLVFLELLLWSHFYLSVRSLSGRFL